MTFMLYTLFISLYYGVEGESEREGGRSKGEMLSDSAQLENPQTGLSHAIQVLITF